MRKKYIVFTVLVLVLGLLSHASQNTFAQEDIPKPTKISLERLQSLIEDNPISATSLSDLSKLDSHLMDLVSSELSGADIVQTAQANDLQIDNNQKVLVDVYINGDLDQSVVGLQEMGMLVLATNSSFGVVEGYLPVSSILSATSLEQTKAFLPITMFGTDTGSVTSEGDASHNGPVARALGPNGSGVVVGVISDSMNQVGAGLSGSQGSGDLPAGVTVLLDGTQYDSDEGRAMAEIIYDTAPGITSMFFHSGTTSGPAGKAAAIGNLVSSGVDIIADDISYLTEPFFQDGMVADAVDAAYTSGVAYFASAGNRADQSYEAYYRDSGQGWHDFDSGEGIDELQTVATIPNNGSIHLVLQWDDPWGASTHDFDVYLLDPNDYTLSWGESDNIASGLPVEELYWKNTTGAPVTVGLLINLYDGASGSFLKYITSTDIDEYNTSSDAINPGAASANGSLAVAAVYWNDTGLNDPEYYSSRGLKTRLFDTNGIRLSTPDIRQKPNVAGADCVSTSSNFSGGTGFGGGTFCGTSAAAPSVAGVAALILSDDPTLTPNMLYLALENSSNTVDCTLSGNPDSDCGYGFVLADNAVSWVRNNTAKVDVTIGGDLKGNYDIVSGSSVRPRYTGVDAGPVIVDSVNIDVIAAIRDAWSQNGVVESWAQLMGLPSSQLSTSYYFPAYNNVNLNDQLRFANLGASATTVTVKIGNSVNETYVLQAGEAKRVRYTGIDDGPVIVSSSGENIIAAIRDAWSQNGVVESWVQLMGLPLSQLSTSYYFPAYNNVNLNDQLRFANLGASATTVTVKIGNSVNETYVLQAGEAKRVRYTGIDDGPVIVSSSGENIIAAIRDAWSQNGVVQSWSQLMGIPSSQLSTSYYFPAYNNVNLNDQLRFANLGASATTVTVKIGNSVNETYVLQAGEAKRVRYTGVDDGPVIVSNSGENIIAAIRDAWSQNGVVESWVQLMGLPSSQLSTSYYFPAYNNVNLNDQIRIGTP